MTKELLQTRYPDLIRVYSQAFAGYPWYESLSDEAVRQRIDKQASATGFELILEDKDDELVGATWYYLDSQQGLSSQKEGDKLTTAIKNLMLENGIKDVVYICETVVAPSHQGEGIATKVKLSAIESLRRKFPEGVLVYTRMRDDNSGIININQKLGFQRTGVKVTSSSNPNVSHEYWYKIIPSNTNYDLIIQKQ